MGKLLVMLLVTASYLHPIDPVFAQEKIRIAWAGASPANAAIWVLQEKKLLHKYGVEPEIISISASPTVLQALLAGEIDVSATSVATLVSSRLAGADTVMILGMVRTFVDHIITAQSIATPDQLKGKIGGVNRIGSTSDLGLRFDPRSVVRLRIRDNDYRFDGENDAITDIYPIYLWQGFSSILSADCT
jgi:ABC-type nitrate/sulfonate/bicarbonate transport system substrate-binding protein